MENGEMKKCPYCAEMIKAEAVKCRYCGSVLVRKSLDFSLKSPQGYWHRVNQGKKIAGVCTGLAAQFEAPVLILPLRVFFVISTLFYGFGLVLYVLLWILMPAPVDTPGAQPAESPYPGGAAAPSPSAPPPVEHYPGSPAKGRAPAAESPAAGNARGGKEKNNGEKSEKAREQGVVDLTEPDHNAGERGDKSG